MTRRELIREVSFRTGYTQLVCSEIIKEMVEVIGDELEEDGDVQLPKLGVFDVYVKKPTKVRVPDTGELIDVGEKIYPRFIPSEKLKKKVRKNRE